VAPRLTHRSPDYRGKVPRRWHAEAVCRLVSALAIFMDDGYTRPSILDYLIDAVDHSGDVAAELKKKRPENFDARPVLDKDSQKWENQAQ